MTTRPFYGRLGGKSKSAKKLIAMFPAATTYVEPFMGAGNIVLRIPKGKYAMEHINDLDPRMYQLMSDVRLIDTADIDKMDFTPRKGKWLWLHTNSLFMEAGVHRFHGNIYTIWYSFMGMGKTFANQSRSIDYFKRLQPRVRARLEGVTITNMDAMDVIDDHKDNEEAFMYLDPPYPDTCCKAYSNETMDLEKLRDKLASAKCKWMLTYNDHPTIRDLYKDFKIIENRVEYHMGGRGRVVTELVIMNY